MRAPEPDIIGAELTSDPYRHLARWREIEPVVLAPRHLPDPRSQEVRRGVAQSALFIQSDQSIHSSREPADVGVAPIPMMSREQ